MKKGVDYTGITTSFICHDGHGKFVFTKRSQNTRDEHGRWDCGGGGLEFGETAEACLRREIKEELCADIISFEFMGYRDVFREQNGVQTHWLALDFKVLVDPAQVAIGEPDMCDELRWVTFDDLPEPLHSQQLIFFAKYKDKILND